MSASGETAVFEFTGGAAAQENLLRGWVEAGLPVCAFGEERQNLQDAYLARVSANAETSP